MENRPKPACVIFCAGEFDTLAEPIAPDSYLIAADGGLRHLHRLGLKPHAVLGDFDSLGYVPDAAAVFPVEKDDTDTMLAIRHGLHLGFRRFVIYGGMDGPRLDHTLANLQALLFLAERGACGYLVGCHSIARAIFRASVRFPADCTGILSLLCMGSDARGVTLEGLQYPLENAVLTSAYPLGVSNHFTGAPARVTVAGGALIALWDRINGLTGQEEEA